MNRFQPVISGHLDITVTQEEEEWAGIKETWSEIQIHGDPEGLRSLAELLMKLADVEQENIQDLPIGAREHVHLRPNLELSKSSEIVIVGRLDARGTGAFYNRYIPKNK